MIAARLLGRGACAVALALATAGCSGSPEGAAPSSGTPGAGPTTTAAPPTTSSPTPCGGEGTGIVRSACDGTATVRFDRGDEHGEVGGGTCETTVAYLEVTAGTETAAAFDGPRPDLADLLLPVDPGPFADGTATIAWNGVEVVLDEATGTHDGASGTFAGTLPDGRRLEGTFTC
ncbi:MAG: hypothetical protein KDB04_05430 [Acidimicrobiales bacterium]|nr:hypothetical protein [Acidimicrobiales bacterium]